MKDNTLKDQNGNSLEVYSDQIYVLADEYIRSLDCPDDIKGMNKGLFTGMIKYIYMHCFKNNPIDNNDIELLDSIFNIYTSLCYKYNKRPTLLNFSLMVGIAMDTFNSWKNQDTRGYIYFDLNDNRILNLPAWKLNHKDEQYRQELGSSHSETVKKWLRECESSLVDGAIEQNGIGCIFALKANYGYTETAPAQVPYSGDQRKTIEQIAQEHSLKSLDSSDSRDIGAQPEADF